MAADPVIRRYLFAASRELDGAAIDTQRLLAELEAHLEESAERLQASGHSPASAAEVAVSRCGTATALLTAVHENHVNGDIMAAITRWTGVAGILATATGVTGAMFWNPVLFVLTFVLLAAAVAGILVRHWHASPMLVIGSVVLFGLGNVAASVFPPAANGFVLGMALPAGLVMASALTLGTVLHRAAIIPRPATWVWLAGLAIAIAANVAGRGAETGFAAMLQNAGALVALAGWIWINAALARGSGGLAPALPEPS